MAQKIWDEVQGRYDFKRIQEILHTIQCSPDELLLDEWTPLHYICENQSIQTNIHHIEKCIHLLLSYGINPNTRDENGWTALHLLCKNTSYSKQDITPCIQHFITFKADFNLQTMENKRTSLHLLCENEQIHENSIETILKANVHTNLKDISGNVALHYICENPSLTLEMLECLLKSTKESINVMNDYQSTAFHNLCQNSNISVTMVKIMLKYGADPSAQNNIGNTPLHYICENPSLSVPLLKLFLECKQIKLMATNALGRTAFDTIQSSTHPEDVVSFVSNYSGGHRSKVVKTTSSGTSSNAGGEDPSDLPSELQDTLKKWNDTLPPFDMTFYHAICCDQTFSSEYEMVQETSMEIVEAYGESKGTPNQDAWKNQLSKWRACVLLAFAALIPLDAWSHYTSSFNRPIPQELKAHENKIEQVWKNHPQTSESRKRLEKLRPYFQG